MRESDLGNDELIFADEPDLSETVPNKERWNVLVVDDSFDVHSTLALFFTNRRICGRGLKMTSILNTKDAYEILRDHASDFHVILLDCVMDGNDHAGFDVAMYLRRELEKSSPPIIMRSGYAGPYGPQSILVSHPEIDAFVEKAGFDSNSVLLHILEHILSRHSVTQGV